MNTPFLNAKWIWHNDFHKTNVYLNFYQSLCAKKGKKYILYISADSNYALYINGKFFESGQFADYPEYKVYDELNVTDALCEGENQLHIVGYWQGMDSSTYRKESAGLLFEMLEDGNSICASGENTRVSLNSAYKSDGVSLVTSQLGFGFEYDCTKEDEKIGLKNADVQEKSAQMYPRPVKKLCIGEEKECGVAAKGEFRDVGKGGNLAEIMYRAYLCSHRLPDDRIIFPNNDGVGFKAQYDSSCGVYVVIDLGEECAGYTKLRFEVPEECDVLVGYGEHLEDLRVRSTIGVRVFTNKYHAKKGVNEFFAPMRRLGLRYMQLHIYSPDVKIYYAGICPTNYPLNRDAFFKCSDHLHNKIYEVCVNTLVHCMHEHYEDCPWREQALYSMDSRNQMLCGYYAFGEYDFAKASIRLIAKSIREDNLIELCSPARCPITIPCFCAILVTQVYEYLLYSGDKDFAREMLDTIKAITDEFVSRRCENGLIKALHEPKYWNFYEWQTNMSGSYGIDDPDKITYDAPLNCFVSMALRSLSNVYGILGNKAQKEKYFELHKDINNCIEREFWCCEKKAYYTYINVNSGEKSHFAKLTQALVADCDAVPEEKMEDVLYAIAKGDLYEATLSHSVFVYDALMKKPEKYARFVLDDIADRWGKMLYNNATTFWETEKGSEDFHGAGSLCHGWSAVPLYVYFRYALGIVPGKDPSPVDCGLYECCGKTVYDT